MTISCPKCRSSNTRKNGHIHNGKQNQRCKEYGRQFVEDSKQKLISLEDRERIRDLLLERISLCGICRSMKASLC